MDRDPILLLVLQRRRALTSARAMMRGTVISGPVGKSFSARLALWVLWVGATAAGWLIPAAIGVNPATVLAAALATCLLRWLVLRSFSSVSPHFLGAELLGWVVVPVLGGGVGAVVLGGPLLALSEWWVLRQHFARTVPWLIGATGAWYLSLVISGIIGYAIGATEGPVESDVFTGPVFLVFAAIFGATTGLVLVSLVSRPRHGDINAAEETPHPYIVETAKQAPRGVLHRVTAALKGESALFRAVSQDSALNTEAVCLVLLVSLATAVGGVFVVDGEWDERLLIGGLGLAVTSGIWLLGSGVVFLAGRRLSHGSVSFGALLRASAYAFLPNALDILSPLPPAMWIRWVDTPWALVLWVIAIRETFGFTTGRAVGTLLLAVAAVVIPLFTAAFIAALFVPGLLR